MKLKNKTRKMIVWVSASLIILTHVLSLCIELSESMWLGHNIFMIILGGLILYYSK